jgi:ribonuclease HI
MSNNFNVVSIYSDGGCRGNGKNNNIGAYAYLINYEKGYNALNVVEYSQVFKNTTNNQMEILGAISALEALEHSSIVTVYSDSKYLCDAVNNGWITNWKKNGWKTAKKEPVKNQDLWLRLDELMTKHHCKFSWVKGHADNVFNNRCDELLNIAMDNYNDDTDTISVVNDVVSVNNCNTSSNSNNVVNNNKVTVNSVDLDIDVLKRLVKMRDELNDILKLFNL